MEDELREKIGEWKFQNSDDRTQLANGFVGVLEIAASSQEWRKIPDAVQHAQAVSKVQLPQPGFVPTTDDRLTTFFAKQNEQDRRQEEIMSGKGKRTKLGSGLGGYKWTLSKALFIC